MITFICALVILFMGYFLYGRLVERVFKPDDRPTPAVKDPDGVNHVPMKAYSVLSQPETDAFMIGIKDGDTESLIRKYLKAGVMNNGRYEATELGTPQGGNLSPLLSLSVRLSQTQALNN